MPSDPLAVPLRNPAIALAFTAQVAPQRGVRWKLTHLQEVLVNPRHKTTMLQWALTFLVFALIAALFGFGGIAADFAAIAKILFFIFLALFVVSLIVNLVRGKSPPTP